MDHEITILQRKRIVVSDVSSVDGFDEGAIFISLHEGGLIIYGTDLHMEGLDLEEGILNATGNVISVEYTKKKERKTWWERFRR